MDLVWIAIGGATGAAARYLVDGAVSHSLDRVFPWGTFAVNLSGSFALGLLYALAIQRQVLPEAIRGPVLIGFIGAYTTVSTLMLESWRLVEIGSVGLAVGNIVGSVGLGLLAVILGLALGRAFA